MARLSGHEAIEFAATHDGTQMYASYTHQSPGDEAEAVTVEQARDLVNSPLCLVWCDTEILPTILVIDADGTYGDEGARVWSAHRTVTDARRSVRGSHRLALVSTGGPDGSDRVGQRIPRASLDALLMSGWSRVESR